MWTTHDQTAASKLYGGLSLTQAVAGYHVKMLGHDLPAALTKDRTQPSLIKFLDLHQTLDLHATWINQFVNALHLFRLERQLVTGLRMAVLTRRSLRPLSFWFDVYTGHKPGMESDKTWKLLRRKKPQRYSQLIMSVLTSSARGSKLCK